MASSSSSAWDAPGGGPAGGGRRRGPRGNYGGSEVVLRAAGPAPAPSGGPYAEGGWSPYEDCHAGAGAGAGGGREGEGRRKEGRAWLYFKAKAGRRATGGTRGTLPLSRRDKARGFGPQRASRHGRQGRRRWRPEPPGPAEAPAPAKPGWVLTPRAYAGGRPVAEGVEGTAGPVTENVTPRKDEAAELGELASPRAEGGRRPRRARRRRGAGTSRRTRACRSSCASTTWTTTS